MESESRLEVPAEAWLGLEPLRPRLRTFLRRRCRTHVDREEIVQETLVRAARYRSGLSDPQRLAGWVLSIAANVLSERHRRARRMSAPPWGADGLAEISGREPDPAAVHEEPRLRLGSWLVDREDAMRWMGEELDRLDERDRRVLRSFYTECRSGQETAAHCGIPPTLVKLRLFRARQRLLRAMRRRIAIEGGREEHLEAVR